jgi:hypothetical protein
MTRRCAHPPAVIARWLSLLESFGYMLSEVETVVRDDAGGDLTQGCRRITPHKTAAHVDQDSRA